MNKNMSIRREDWKYFLFIGAIGYFVSVGAQIVGTKYAGASVASLINATNPIFITFFAVLILGEADAQQADGDDREDHRRLRHLGGAQTVGSVWGIAFSMMLGDPLVAHLGIGQADYPRPTTLSC